MSTIPGRDKALVLLEALKHHGFTGHAALTADTMQHRAFLLAAGADIVLLPFRDAATDAADMLASHSEKRSEEPSKIDEQWNSHD